MQKADAGSQAQRPTNNNRPVHTLRHRRIKATIWRNETEKGPMFNVTIIRAYREKDTGDWKETHNIGYDDLMNVAALMYESHGFISSLLAKNAGANSNSRR